MTSSLKSSVGHQGIALAWLDGRWYSADSLGFVQEMEIRDDQGEFTMPVLPEGSNVYALLLPVEELLVRPFSLPLAKPSLLDAAILSQEIEDQSGEECSDWWLAWQVQKTDTGVSGLVVGMPMALRRQLEREELSPLLHVRIGALERLARWVEHFDLSEDEPVAVVDEDSTGVVLGVLKNDIWQGIERINNLQAPGIEDRLEIIKKTLGSMGWTEGQPAIGRLSRELSQGFDHWLGLTIECDALPTREQAVFEEVFSHPFRSGIEFRHGDWRLSKDLQWMRAYRRSGWLLLLVILVWIAGMMVQNYALERQINAQQDRIVQAFKKALPNQPVIDAVAQLKKAAGVGETGQKVAQVLHHIQWIGEVYDARIWRVSELQWLEGKVKITGTAQDLQTLNNIRDALEKKGRGTVRLADTDLKNGKIGFLLEWSWNR